MKPTQEQVIAWARETTAYETDDPYNDDERIWIFNDEELQDAFALAYEAGRKDENEDCAKVCEELGYYAKHGGWGCADAIRARREQ